MPSRASWRRACSVEYNGKYYTNLQCWKLEAGEGDADFYNAKLDTARFYYAKLLPRTRSLKATVLFVKQA